MAHYQIDEDDQIGPFQPPPPEYWMLHPRHRWEAEKLDMDLDDVFTTLPKRFNMMAIPILDQDAFHLEIQYVAHKANDVAGFYELLKSRMEERRREQLRMMEFALMKLAGDPMAVEIPNRGTKHWVNLLRIGRTKSFDAVINLISGFSRDQTANMAAGHRNEKNTDAHSAAAATSTQHQQRSQDLDEESVSQPAAAPRPAQSSENAPSDPPPPDILTASSQ